MAGNWLKDRLRRLFSNLRGIDAVLIANSDRADPNFLYLTGFTSGLFEESLLIAVRDSVYVFTYSLEYQTALDQRQSGMRVINIADDVKAARSLLKRLIKGKRIGVNGSFISFSTAAHLRKRYGPKRFADISDKLTETRLIKDRDEIRKIRSAARITKTAMKRIGRYLKAGVTELQLAAQFDFIQMSLGASGPSFGTIVCFGKNAAQPHHSPDNTKLRRGDFVLIDAGTKVSNYCSDITRTFVFGRRPSPKEEEMISIVKRAQHEAILAIRPGKRGNEIHNIAAKVIDTSAGGRYKGRFIHSLGHSVGLEVHDGPGFSTQKNIIRPGMVITAEPGIYVPGFGGVRIEDDILITRKGYKIL